MAIPRVDITAEINDWRNAVYGEEVRDANVSALTKLQTQMNDACDEIEDAVDDVTAAVGTAQNASSVATQAAEDVQTAITQAQAAITTAQSYASAAESSAQESASHASDSQSASNSAQTYAANASQSASAAESAAQRAETVVNIHPDEVSITKAIDGELSVITLSKEEIEMSTDPDELAKQVPSAGALSDVMLTLDNYIHIEKVTLPSASAPVGYWDVPFTVTPRDGYTKCLAMVESTGASPCYTITPVVMTDNWEGHINGRNVGTTTTSVILKLVLMYLP